MTELAMVKAKLVVALPKNRASRGGCGESNRTNRGRGSRSGLGAGTGTGSGSPARTGAGAPSTAKEKDLEPPIHYCWTCGPGCRHNSAKCPALSAGHIYTATKRNMQGGAEATKRNRRVEAVINNLISTLNHLLSYTLVTPPVELAVADSGCTSYFLPATCACDNKVAVLHVEKRVRMTNGETMVETHKAILPFPQPPPICPEV